MRSCRAAATAAALLLLGGLAGCSSGGGASRADAGRKILRIAYDREIDVLNVFTSQNLVDISFSMVEGLVTTNERNEYIPVLAREIPTEANGLVVINSVFSNTWGTRPSAGIDLEPYKDRKAHV